MTARRFSLLVGCYLLITGVWGLFSPVVWGALSTNTLHAVIEIVVGATGIYVARLSRHGHPRMYCTFVGLLLLTVAALYLIPATHRLVSDLLAVNMAVAVANVLVGLMALGVRGMGSRG